jgi:hypothetical protein
LLRTGRSCSARFVRARSLGATLLAQSVVVTFAFESMRATSPDRAWLIADTKPTPRPSATNAVFGHANDDHENLRWRALLQQQMRDFSSHGTATNPCTDAMRDGSAGNCSALRE